MLVQLKSGHHKFGIPSSATVMNNRKSNISQKSKPPSIPRRCASSRENWPSSSSGSKRFRERDLSEANANEERMRKKPKDSSKVTMEAKKAEVHEDSIASKKKKLTGRSYKSHCIQKWEATTVPVTVKTATDNSENLLNFQGKEEHVDSDSSSKKRRRLTKMYVQSSQDTNVSSRVIPADEEDTDKEKPNVDGGTLPVLSSSLQNAKDTIEENSAKKEHNGDQDDTPSQQKLGLQDISVDSDAGIILNDLPICDKRWEKFFQKEKEEIQGIQRIWKDDVSKLDTCKKVEMDLNNFQKRCDKRWVKLIREQKEQFKKIQQDISKLEKNKVLEAALIRVIHGKCSTTTDKLHALDCKFVKQMAEINDRKDKKFKDQKAERDEEIKKVANWASELKASFLSKLGAKDVMPLTEQHEVNNYSSTTVQGKNVVQSNNSDRATVEEVACNAPKGNPSSASISSVKNESGLTFSVTSMSAVVEQINQPKHLGIGESICASIPASGERVPGELQSPELHEDIPSVLHETLAKDNANPVNVSNNTPIEGFGEEDAIELRHAENFASGERIFQNLPASGESFPGEVRPLELHRDVELPETVVNEIDLPDAEQRTAPKHFGSAERVSATSPASEERVEMQSLELHKDVPSAELAETVDKTVAGIVNPVELSDNNSIERYGEEDAIHLADARSETEGTAIDDPDLDGQVLETLEQTKTSQHPCTLLPLRVQEDQDVVCANLQGHGVDVVGKANSSLSEVLSPEFVDTATNYLTNIEPQAQEEPAIETQSSSRTEVSTSKIMDAVIAELSSVKLQDQETSVVKNQVTQPIELVDSERVDTAAPAAILELVGSAKTLQSDNEFQDHVEPAVETQSSSRTEVSTSKIIDTIIAERSSVKLQDHETSVVKDHVTSQIELVDSESVNTLAPSATLELVGTAKTLQSDNKLKDQVEPAIETQSTPGIEVAVSEDLNNTSPILTSTERQNEVALIVENRVHLEIEVSNSGVADNVTHVQSNIDCPSIESGEQLQFTPIDASPSCNQLPSLELESRNQNLGSNSSVAAEIEMLSHESTFQLIEDCLQILGGVSGNQSFPATRVQIPVSFENNVAAEVVSTNGVLNQAVQQLGGVNHIHSHHVPPSNFPSQPFDPFQSELENICKKVKELEKSLEDMMSGLKSEYKKEMEEVRRKYQLKFEVAQAQFSLERNRLEQNLKKVSMNKKLADAFKLRIQGYPPSSSQCHLQPVRVVGATPLNQQITSLNRQGMQQLSVPPSTTLYPFTRQIHAAPSVQAVAPQQAAAAQQTAAMNGQWAINGVNRMSNMRIPRSGENTRSSSPHIRPLVSAAAPYNLSASLLSTFQNPQHQQQQQHQQLLLAPQWQSNSQNPGHLGSLSYAYLPALAQRNQIPG